MKKNVLLTMICFCLAFFAKAETTDISGIENVVYVENVSSATGSEFTLSIMMKNIVGITGFQFDLVLADGVTVAKDEDDFNIVELSSARTTNKKTDYFNNALQSDGSLRIMASSTQNYTFSGNDGEVATIRICIADNVADGTYPIVLKNIVLSDAAANSYETERVEAELTVSSGSENYEEGYFVSIAPLFTEAGKNYDENIENEENLIAVIKMSNLQAISKLEFDIELPDGIEIGTYRTGTGTKKDPYVYRDDIYYGGVYMSEDNFPDIESNHVTAELNFAPAINMAPVILLPLTTDSELNAGIYPIKMSNIEMTDLNGEKLNIHPLVTSYVKVGNPNEASLAVEGYVSAELNEALATENSLGTLDMSKVTGMDGALTIVDGRNFVAPKTGIDVESVSYTRLLTSEYGTICLPFALESNASVQYYKLTSVSETTMTFEEVASLEAGEPALFKSLDGNTLSIDATNETLAAGNMEKVQDVKDWTIVGTYEESSVNDADYIIANNKFWNAGQLSEAEGVDGVKVAPFRAYFHYTSARAKARSLSIYFEEGAMAIETISAITEGNAEFYNLNGHKVVGLQNGVNIVKFNNGKNRKIIIK